MKGTIRLIVIGAIGVLLVGLAVFFMVPHATPVACTQEAKICPDGTSVGRTGPNCEFAACPTSPEAGVWNSVTDPVSGVYFRYPASLGTNYLHPEEWPPKVTVAPGPYQCTEVGAVAVREGVTAERIIAGHVYCVTISSEGAAGSTFTTYAYTSAKGNRLIEFSFTLRMVQCANFDEPKKTECEKERAAFDIDSVVDRVMQTAQLPAVVQ